MTQTGAYFSRTTRRWRPSRREIRMLKLGLTITALSMLAVTIIGSMPGSRPAKQERSFSPSPSNSRTVDPNGNPLTPRQTQLNGKLPPKKWTTRFHSDEQRTPIAETIRVRAEVGRRKKAILHAEGS